MALDDTSSAASSSALSASSPRSTALPSAAASTAPSSAPSPGGSDDDDDSDAKASDEKLAQAGEDFGGPLDERRHFPLLDWQELSPWMKDFESEYTLVGYRRQQNSVLGCFYSAVGYIHNETVNILTHGLGALYLLPHIYSHLFLPAIYRPTIRWTDKMHFSVFLCSAAICLGMSGCYHTLSCHSRTVSKLWNRLDYVGIVILIVGSNYPSLFYGFWCDLHLQVIYTSVITILGCLAIYTVLSDKFTTGAYRWARTMVFISLGMSAVVPVSHALLAYGFERSSKEMGLNYLLGSGGLYIAGAINYALRYPERKHPRIFDIFGSSHQIFHFAVLAAAYLHYRSIAAAASWHHDVNLGMCRGDEI